jgi:hypothetical protein
MSDYNIHIHLPENRPDVVSAAEIPRPEKTEPVRSEAVETGRVGEILSRVKMCVDWRTFAALGPELPSIGLAMVETSGRGKVLCRLANGKPLAERILDDYIYLGEDTGLIAPQYLELITNFIRQRAGRAQPLEVPRGSSMVVQPKLYGKPIVTMAEGVVRQAQMIGYVANLLCD